MNINKFKQSLKKNNRIDALSRILFYPLFKYQYISSDAKAHKRKSGATDSEFEWIKELHNTHLGERCFVVATGPSLKMEDLEMIKAEYSFSMNSAVLILNKTLWKPDVYMIQDEYVYEKLKDDIARLSNGGFKNIWISQNLENKYDEQERYKVFPLHYLDHKMYHKNGYGMFRFSDDCYSTIYDGYTITFSVMQMAVYMGFREIYLLGCDCNYQQPKMHFIEYGHKDPKAAVMGDKMIAGHFEFKKFAESLGVKVINCTRGGMLEVYPRMSLEDVLGGNI